MSIYSSAVVTREFKIDSVFPERWFDDLKRIWNESIFYLNWLQACNRAKRNNALQLPAVEIITRKIKSEDKDDGWVSYCWLTKDFRLDKTKSWDKENLHQIQLRQLPDGTFEAYSLLLVQYYTRWLLALKLNSITHKICCANLPKQITNWNNINDFDLTQPFFINPKFLTEPPISQFNSFELKKPFAKKRCEWLKNSDIPAIYINDYIELIVYPAWEAYQKGNKGKPLYKRPKDKVKTIKSASFRGQCKVESEDKIVFPKLDAIKVNGFEERLLNPIKDLVEKMLANPEQYDALQSKIKRIKSDETSRLIKVDGKKRKELSPEELLAYEQQLDDKEIFSKAIDYFSKPGSFAIVRRGEKTYLQITAEVPVTITETERQVGVNTGLDLLVESSTGIKIKHPNFIDKTARLDTLRTKLSAMKVGSNNHKKLSAKIAKISARIARAKKGKHDYAAQWLADGYGEIVLKKVKPNECIENPIPIRSKDGVYLPNGKSDAKTKNEELMACAIGNFAAKLKQQAQKRKRVFAEVSLEAEATPEEVLCVGSSDHASSTEAHKSLNDDAREGVKETRPDTSGKGKPTASNIKSTDAKSKPTPKLKAQKAKPQYRLSSEAATPEPSAKKKRNKKREKKIN